MRHVSTLNRRLSALVTANQIGIVQMTVPTIVSEDLKMRKVMPNSSQKCERKLLRGQQLTAVERHRSASPAFLETQLDPSILFPVFRCKHNPLRDRYRIVAEIEAASAS